MSADDPKLGARFAAYTALMLATEELVVWWKSPLTSPNRKADLTELWDIIARIVEADDALREARP